MTIDVTLAHIQAAQERIVPHIPPSRLLPVEISGRHVWLKMECENLTGSFKIRGALNALLSLSDADRSRGVVAASSGNHAQGVAYAAHLAGVDARIYMPAHTPRKKVQGVEKYGAKAMLWQGTYDDAEAEAHRVADAEGAVYISPYNDANIIAGAGTIGLELAEQLPDVGRVVVPVSGGGLIAGVGTAIKARLPRVQVIGVNALSAPHMFNLFEATQYEENFDTLAEALSGGIEADSITVPMAWRVVDKMVTVTEAQIVEAIRWLHTRAGIVAEGGGSVGVAALLHGIIPPDESPTVIVISGGNIDADVFNEITANPPANG